MELRIGHSPDPDDAFMYWALAHELVDRRGLDIELVIQDIQTLNQWARAARLDVTALSLGAYPFVQQDYTVLAHGASIGYGYGPVLVGHRPFVLDELRQGEVVVPGRYTTAFLILRLALGFDVAFRELPFEAIPEEVASGRADYGVLIHEGQLLYREMGLHLGLDLGEWWLLETGLPLPLGVVVARRDLGHPLLSVVSDVIEETVAIGIDRRDEALSYALEYANGIDPRVVERYVTMYVNPLTRDYGDEGRLAIEELLRRGEAGGYFPSPVQLDYVGG